MQLKYKISITMTLFSLLILGLVSYFYGQMSYKSVLKHEKQKILEGAVESAREIKVELLSKLSNVKTISLAPIVLDSLKINNVECATDENETLQEHIQMLNERWMHAYDENDAFVKPYLNNPLALFLKEQQTAFSGVYGEIFITNSYGVLVATTGKLTTLSHAHKYWWQEAYADGKGKVFFDDRGFDASVNGYVIGIVVPIKADGEIIGILKANVNIMTTLSSAVKQYKKLNMGTLAIARTKGAIVYEESLPPLSTSVNPKILKNLQQKETGSRVIKNYNQEVLVAYAPVEMSLDDEKITFGGKPKTSGSFKGNNGEIWHTVIKYDKKLALRESRDTNINIILIGLVLTFFSFLASILIGRWISSPVEKLQQAQAELQKQEEIMVAQSRHAAMGEMISMIAHQWRQPISVIAMGANNIMADVELEMVDEKRLEIYSKDILNKTQELSKTIDDFKNFFRPDKELSNVLVEDILNDVFSVVGQSLANDDIEVTREFHNGREIQTYKRELMQVLINIVKNAKEAIDASEAKERKISIVINETKDEMLIQICDSGGGIKEEIMGNIFDPYFSTKSQNVGTGIGLYMSKTIIEKHLNGILSAYNLGSGACFEIRLPLTIETDGEHNE